MAQAAARAAEANRGVTVRYVAPKEGAQIGFDMLAIPADAPHPDTALQFINFLLQPDVMAGITNAVRYPNAVPASRADDPSGPAERPGGLSDARDDGALVPRSARCRSLPTRADAHVGTVQGGRQ